MGVEFEEKTFDFHFGHQVVLFSHEILPYYADNDFSDCRHIIIHYKHILKHIISELRMKMIFLEKKTSG